MGWFLRDIKGPAWKQVTSMSLPPLPFLAIFLITFLLPFASSYANYKTQMQQTVINFKLFLLFLPVLLIFVVVFISNCERFMFPITKADYGAVDRNWNIPWGVAVLLVVLLVMISYWSSFLSMWSPIVWNSD